MNVFFSSRRRHTRYWRDWSSDVCSSDLLAVSFTSTRNLVMQASKDNKFSVPPKASNTPLANSSFTSVFSFTYITDSLPGRSEEHTSELQSRQYIVCRLLFEKKLNHTHRSTQPTTISHVFTPFTPSALL